MLNRWDDPNLNFDLNYLQKWAFVLIVISAIAIGYETVQIIRGAL